MQFSKKLNLGLLVLFMSFALNVHAVENDVETSNVIHILDRAISKKRLAHAISSVTEGAFENIHRFSFRVTWKDMLFNLLISDNDADMGLLSFSGIVYNNFYNQITCVVLSYPPHSYLYGIILLPDITLAYCKPENSSVPVFDELIEIFFDSTSV